MINAKDIKQAITDPMRTMIDFGVQEELLTTKGSACPICGDGTDRFSYDRNKYNGERVFCRVCGSLDYLEVIQQFNGWDFKTLINELADYTGLSNMDVTQRESLQEQRQIAENAENKRLKTEYFKSLLLVDLSVLFKDNVDLEQLSIAERTIKQINDNGHWNNFVLNMQNTEQYRRHKKFIAYYGACVMNERTDIVQLIKCYKFLASEPTDLAYIKDAKAIILLHKSFGALKFDEEWLKKYFSYYAKILRGDR